MGAIVVARARVAETSVDIVAADVAASAVELFVTATFVHRHR